MNDQVNKQIGQLFVQLNKLANCAFDCDLSLDLADSTEQILSDLQLFEEKIKNANATKYRTISEESLNDSFVSKLINSMPDGLVALNEKGEIIAFNLQAETIFGYSREEILGQWIETLMPARFTLRHEELIAGYFKAPVTRKMGAGRTNLFGRRKNGEEFPIGISLSVLETENGKIAISSVRDITDKVALIKEVENREKKLVEITSVIPAIVYQIEYSDHVARFTFISNVIKSVLNIEPEDVYRNSDLLFSKIHKDDLHKTFNAIDQSNRDNSSYAILFRLMIPDGKIIWVKALGVPHLNADGSITRTGCFIDVTESVEYKRLLEESLGFNRNVIDSLTSQIVVLNYDGAIVSSNKAWNDFMSYNDECFLCQAFSGVNLLQGISTMADKGLVIAQELLSAIENIKCKGTEYEEFQYSCNIKGTVKWFVIRVMCFQNDLPYFVLSHRDISEIKYFESELQETKHRYRNLLDSTDEMINTVALDGKLLWANHSWKKNLLYDDDDINDLRLADILSDSTKIGFKQRIANIRKGFVIDDFSGALIAKNGATLHIEGRLMPYFENGVVCGTQGFFRNTTEINKIKNDRIKIENRLSNILDNMLTGCTAISRDFIILYANMAAATQAFSQPDDLVGNSVFELFSGSENRLVIAKFTEAIVHQCKLQFNEEFSFPNGVTKCFDFLVEPIDEGIFVMTVDITDRVNAENILQKNQLLLTESQRIAHLGSWELDLNTNVLNWSDEVYRIFEIDKNTFAATYEAFLDLIHPEDRDYVNSSYTKSASDHMPYEIGHRLLFPDGRIKYVLEQGETIYDITGKPIRSVGTVHDITAKWEADLQLKNNERKFQQVVENINDGLNVRDVNGNILYCNRRFLDLFGLEESDLANLKLADLIAEEHSTRMVEQHYRRFDGNDVPSFFEFLGRKKDGEKRWFETLLTENFENGNIVSVQSIVRDITERKLAEQQLESQNTELKKINSELDSFVYSTSHDLRAPLLSVLGLINLSREAEDKTELKNYFDMMEFSVLRIDETIKSILAYSKNSRLIPKIEKINIREIVNDYLDSVLHLNGMNNIYFNIDVKEEMHFYSDKFRISTIIINLLNNAIKYQKIDQENPLINCRFTSDSAEGIFIIEDNGEGIEKDKLEKIFEMFYRNSDQSEGAGLGLYICREIADKLGGSINVSSRKRVGSTFTVKIPNNYHKFAT